MQTKFSSKVDSWLIPVMVLAMAGLLAALIAVLVTPTPWPVRVLVAAVSVAVVLLLFAVFRGTHYTITEQELRIVSGPFRWTIPVDEITAIDPSRNPLSSPALSLDRLKISYGKRKFVLISPSDKAGFMRAMEQVRGVQE
jgi:membrane protein YdbS with pleckstrin-like domain